jgi:16S rRNA (adenine1518-N6/adenine1519-N6)-dimethyltransferase
MVAGSQPIITGQHIEIGNMDDSKLARKSLGQHWLKDQDALEQICDAAKIGPEDVVLEIGPGLGHLTEILVDRANKVIAVELDNYLIGLLKTRLSRRNLSIIEGDILRYDLRKLPREYKVVANIPYYLTSNLLRVLCETENPFSEAALLVQKEVAERVVAKPGSMSLLSISVQLYCEASLGMVVPAELFSPPPKVNSQILVLSRRDQPLFPKLDTKEFFRVVKAGFGQRRKTLVNSLSGGLRIPKEQTEEILKNVGIEPGRRPQTLDLEEWHKLYLAISPA